MAANEPGVYKGLRVMVTGHTGFKGSWLALWLQQLGAEVIGYSKDVPTKPSHFELLKKEGLMAGCVDIRGDINDAARLEETMRTYRPRMLFHLAAQPLVRYGYDHPVETFETNVMGTLRVFEAARSAGVGAVVNITSDKCYENKEQARGYREDDPLGGYDPYSASKGCAEILTASYRRSYFHPDEYGRTHRTLLASCRAGNVIGGGDWGADRLVPDLVQNAAAGSLTLLRRPRAVRPWQHVLEPLHGYLTVGRRLLTGERTFARAWNFGPDGEGMGVEEVARRAAAHWPRIAYEVSASTKFHETSLLRLDSSLARRKLNWRPRWDTQKALQRTVEWYRAYYEEGRVLSLEHLEEYIKDGNGFV